MMLTKTVMNFLGRPGAAGSHLIRAGMLKPPAPLGALGFQNFDLKFYSAKPNETPMDRALAGVLNKEMPGYYDKSGGKTKRTSSPSIDVHNRNADIAFEEPPKLGHRLTCQQVVNILEQHEAVDECVVIDINVEHNGEIPVAFVTKKPGVTSVRNDALHDQLIASLRKTLGGDHEELEKDLVDTLRDALQSDKILEDEIRDDLVQCVRNKVGPFAILKVVIVDALPKTTSGKILRGTLYRIARGQPYSMMPTIEDPNVLKHLEQEIKGLLGDQYED